MLPASMLCSRQGQRVSKWCSQFKHIMPASSVSARYAQWTPSCMCRKKMCKNINLILDLCTTHLHVCAALQLRFWSAPMSGFFQCNLQPNGSDSQRIAGQVKEEKPVRLLPALRSRMKGFTQQFLAQGAYSHLMATVRKELEPGMGISRLSRDSFVQFLQLARACTAFVRVQQVCPWTTREHTCDQLHRHCVLGVCAVRLYRAALCCMTPHLADSCKSCPRHTSVQAPLLHFALPPYMSCFLRCIACWNELAAHASLCMLIESCQAEVQPASMLVVSGGGTPSQAAH